jgi:hypothetical protein
MNEIGLPLRKSGSFMPEDLAITNQPNIPACGDQHFHEEWLIETPLSSSHHRLKISIRRPINLKIVPNSSAERALKQEVHPIFINSSRA